MTYERFILLLLTGNDMDHGTMVLVPVIAYYWYIHSEGFAVKEGFYYEENYAKFLIYRNLHSSCCSYQFQYTGTGTCLGNK